MEEALISYKYKHNNFYISGSMIEQKSGHIEFDCGTDLYNFDEKKLLENLNVLNIAYVKDLILPSLYTKTYGIKSVV